MLGIYTK